MLSQIQRFGGAMFTPVLLFPFADCGGSCHLAAKPDVCRGITDRSEQFIRANRTHY